MKTDQIKMTWRDQIEVFVENNLDSKNSVSVVHSNSNNNVINSDC